MNCVTLVVSVRRNKTDLPKTWLANYKGKPLTQTTKVSFFFFFFFFFFSICKPQIGEHRDDWSCSVVSSGNRITFRWMHSDKSSARLLSFVCLGCLGCLVMVLPNKTVRTTAVWHHKKRPQSGINKADRRQADVLFLPTICQTKPSRITLLWHSTCCLFLS